MRNPELVRSCAAAQFGSRHLALRRIARVAAVDQNVRVNEGSHEEVPDRRRKALRASSPEFRGSDANPLPLLLLVVPPAVRPATSYWHRTAPAAPAWLARARLLLSSAPAPPEYSPPPESIPACPRVGCRTGPQSSWGLSAAVC